MTTIAVPDAVVERFAGRPQVGVWDQAVPLYSVDDDGYPHVALLSRAEVDVAPDRAGLFAVIASPTTRSNLVSRGTAGTTIVSADTAYHLKLQAGATLEAEGALAVDLRLRTIKADSIGIPLRGLGFHVAEDLAVLEQWDRSSRLLDRLRAEVA